MELQSRKRLSPSVDVGGRDRLSEMPDEVIVHILSLMPIMYAVRTVSLRRFGNLWTLIPNLKFDSEEYIRNFYVNHRWEEEDDERFCIFVRNVLRLHKTLCNKFHLIMDLLYNSMSIKAVDKDAWLRFALERQAKEIIFNDTAALCELTSGTLLPDLTSQTLVTLDLNCFKIEAPLEVSLPSLKKLFLDHCFMSNEGFQRFMSGCPSLQELTVMESFDIDKLSLTSPNLEKLSLVRILPHPDENPLSLDCPVIKTLHLDILDQLHIMDVSSVCDIHVESIFPESLNGDKPALATMSKMFFRKFDGAEVIRLSHYVSWHFLDTVQHFNLLQHKWKRVVLELQSFCQVCFVGISHLMNSLRHLEELTIYTTENFEASADLLPLEVSSTYVTPQLKTITLHGYGKAWKSQLRLVEFLLKSAAVLDKLTIVTTKNRLYPWWNTKPAEELEFVKLVSSFPRASASARVLFA